MRYTYTKKVSIVHMTFKLDWAFCILFGIPTPQILAGEEKPLLQFSFFSFLFSFLKLLTQMSTALPAYRCK